MLIFVDRLPRKIMKCIQCNLNTIGLVNQKTYHKYVFYSLICCLEIGLITSCSHQRIKKNSSSSLVLLFIRYLPDPLLVAIIFRSPQLQRLSGSSGLMAVSHHYSDGNNDVDRRACNETPRGDRLKEISNMVETMIILKICFQILDS